LATQDGQYPGRAPYPGAGSVQGHQLCRRR